MFDLTGKTALVTGASQGIGRAIAEALADQGARVIVAARTLGKLESLAAEIQENGGEAFPLVLDLADSEQIALRIGELPEEWSEIDILVNNAGITRDGLFARMNLEQWNEVLNTNLTGSFAVARELVRGMMRRRWDYFVQHLKGVEPPEYSIGQNRRPVS